MLSVDEEHCELFVVTLTSPHETRNKTAAPIMIFLSKLEQIIFISYHLFPVVAFDLKKLSEINQLLVSVLTNYLDPYIPLLHQPL